MGHDPLKVDPTRTTMLRRQFITDMNQRFLDIRRRINRLVVDDDVFGLRPSVNPFDAETEPAIVAPQTATRAVSNAQAFRFETDANKVVKFQEWFQQQIDAQVLSTDDTTGKPWTSTYVDSAYRKGLVRSYTDTHSDQLGLSQDFFAGSKAQFLQEAFAAPESVSKVQMLGTRAFEQLKGVTASMSQNINRVLSDGIARGAGARELGRELNKEVDKLTKTRARMIARTEIVHAHAEGQLDGFERLGVEEVGVMAEWHTAGDDKVCSMCAPLAGIVLTIKEARGMIPRHPNCRCAWIPANVGEKTTGQIWSDEMNALVRDSLKAEFPGVPAATARQLSRWIGAKKGQLQPKSHLKPSAKNKKFVQIQAAQKAAIQEAKAKELAAKKAAKTKADNLAKEKADLNSTINKALAAPLDENATALIEDAQKAGNKLLTGFFNTPDELQEIGGKMAKLTAKATKLKDDVIEKAAAAKAAVEVQKTKLLTDLDLAVDAPLSQSALATIEKGIAAGEDLLVSFFLPQSELLKVGSAIKKLEVKKLQIGKVLDEAKAAVQLADEATAKIAAASLDANGQVLVQQNLDVLTKQFTQQGLTIKQVDVIADQIALANSKLKIIQDTITKTAADDQTLKLALSAPALEGSEDIIKQGKAIVIQRIADLKAKGGFPAAVSAFEDMLEGLVEKATMIKVNKSKAIELAKMKKILDDDVNEAILVDWFAKGPQNEDLLKLQAGQKAFEDLKALGLDPGLLEDFKKEISDFKFLKPVLDKAEDMAFKIEVGGPNFLVGGNTVTLDALEAVADALEDVAASKLVAKQVYKSHQDTIQKAIATRKLQAEAAAKQAAQGTAKTAAEVQSHKVKMGMAKKHYAKPKFGGGVVDEDYVNAQKTKLNESGVNKVLFEKGWHGSTLDLDVFEGILIADDLVAQKAIMDALKKAPKGTPKPPLTVAPPPGTGPTIPFPNEADLVKVRDLPGSTRPYLARSNKDGSLWVVKSSDASGINPDHLRSEALADELYRRAGAPVPQSTILETPSGPVKVSEFLEGGQTLAEWKVGKTGAQVEQMYEQIQRNFVADALFANHDVAGLSFDNIFIVDGAALRIDNGGALAFRAQGAAKANWDGVVDELTSMRDPNINPQTAQIYKTLSDERINNQIRAIVENQDDILFAITDDKLRNTVKARIDYLQAQLPADAKQVPAAASARRKVGNKAAEYGVKRSTGARVSKARSNGVAISSDRGDVEDMNMLAWGETVEGGQEVTMLQFKVTTQGSNKIVEALGDELGRAQAVAPTAVSNVHPDDVYWHSVLAGIKTVNTHAKAIDASQAYNMGTIGTMTSKHDEIKAALKTATGDKKKMLTHYDKMIKDTLKAMKAGKGTKPGAAQYVHSPKKKKADPRKKSTKFRVRTDSGINVRLASFKDGEITVRPGQNQFPTGEAYVIDAGDGIEIKFLPNNGNRLETDGLALHGTVSVKVPANVSNASIRRAMQVLEDLGLDVKPPTPEYEELIYLHRNIYLHNDHTDATYSALFNSTTLSDGEKVAGIKAWASKKYNIDFDNAPHYNPQGEGLHPDGTGFRHWYRWDIDRKDMHDQMQGFSLQHTTGDLYQSPRGAIEGAVRGIMSSGEEFTSTSGRIRKGVSVEQTGGGSSKSDIRSGGASYFFTRIRPDESDIRGFFFSTDNLARQDVVSYANDEFGNIGRFNMRGATVDKYKEFSRNGGNESIFKEGLSLDDIDFIRVWPGEKDAVVKAFKDQGIHKLPDGRKIESVITSTKKPPKARKVIK